jgi:hypothetical protein
MLVMGLLFPTICAGQTAQPITPAVIYDRSHASVVVVIIADRDSNPIGQGSGFIVTRNRVVTNHHVNIPFTPTSLPRAKSEPRITPTTPHPPPAESARNGLFVSSKPPGAEIFINGIKQPGQTPGSLALAPGQYDLVVRMPGYDPYAGHVQVRDNAQTTIDLELKEKTEALAWAQVISSPDGGEIFVDGAPTGQTTPARVQISAGSHIVAIRLVGYRIAKRGVQVSGGGLVTVNEVLQPQPK